MAYPRRFTAIEQMEERARDDEDGRCSRRIGEHYLEVCHSLDDRLNPKFAYSWAAQTIDRAKAVQIMERAVSDENRSRVRRRA
jgi:hypothetical protein